MRRPPLAGLALLCAAALSACGPKLVRVDVYESRDGAVEVGLRHEEKGGEVVPRGYEQPTIISDVRLAHILAHLQYEDKSGNKHPLIETLQVYDLAEGVSKALKEATPDDEVVAVAYRREKNLGIFTTDLVTSFRAYVIGDSLMLDFFAVSQRLDKEPTSVRVERYDVPQQLPDSQLSIDLVAGEAHALRGPRGYAVDWRSDFYRRPISLSTRGIRRRTILMEAEPEAEAPRPSEQPEVSPALRNAQLSALDRLDAERRAGTISEPDFQRRRRLVLEGRLDEAGFPTRP